MNTKNIRSIVVTLAAGLALLGAMPFAALADNAVPTTSSLSPSAATVGSSGFTLTVNGSNFVSGSLVYFNGAARSTTYMSSNQLTASILSSDVSSAGNYNVTVTSPAPGGGTSNAVVFAVNNIVPTTTSISPSSVVSGSAGFTMNVYGTNFASGSSVNFNGSARATSYVSSTQLMATITSSDVASAGSYSITVSNPGPGGGPSNTQTFYVSGSSNNPIPFLSTMSPSSTMAGAGSFTMTVYGSNFVPNSWVSFNGLARQTTFISSSQLSAVIFASDVAITGQSAVAVINPIPGGGNSNAMIFTAGPISAIPVLPNTGFGPSAPSSGFNTGLLAAGLALFGILSAVVLAIKVSVK